MIKRNGLEHVEIDTLGEIPHIVRLQELVGAACDVALAKRGLVVGQRWKAAPIRYNQKRKVVVDNQREK